MNFLSHPQQRDLLLLNGHLLDPATNIDAPRDLLLRNGRVHSVEAPGALASVTEADRIDASGLTITPGLIDLHVHLREPGQTWKETIAAGTRAAARGGVTTVVAMPNTVPVLDAPDLLAWVQSPDRDPAVRLFAMPAATCGSLGQELTDIPALAAAGAVGFTDDGKPILRADLMRAALLAAARLGLPISQHAEDTDLTQRTGGSTGVNAGPLAFRLGLRGMTVEAESSLVARDLDLLRDLERSGELAPGQHPHLHVQHTSTAAALDLIRAAKHEGLHVTCEAAPHHFTLTEDSIRGYNTNAKMNPPLRSAADRDAVLAALLDGTVDCVATDHAPHARFEKEVEFDRAPNGITGLETALGLTLAALQRAGLSPDDALRRALELMAVNPARLLRQPHLGTVAPGSYADLLLLDPRATTTFRVAHSASRSHNTPFDNTTFPFDLHLTLVAGTVAWQRTP